jgi:type II secretory pathway pseudopilin PulG
MRQQGQQLAFTLVEALIIISVLAILAGVAISYIPGASAQARMVVARQQQAELQSALDAWIVATSSGVGSLATAQAAYSGAGSQAAKLELVSGYLRNPALFTTTADGISSNSLEAIGKVLQFSAWTAGGSPSVTMSP